MVDYMRTSMSMRVNWPLKPEDQKTFEGAAPVVPPLLGRRHVACERLDDAMKSSIATHTGFEYVSNKVFEEELERANSVPAGAFGALGL